MWSLFYCKNINNLLFKEKVLNDYSEGFSVNDAARMIYTQKEAGQVMINMSRTTRDEMPKNSAIPPHTPNKDLSLDDFISFLTSNPSQKFQLYKLYQQLVKFVTFFPEWPMSAKLKGN